MRVSNSPRFLDHTEECALWDSSTFPAASNQTLTCGEVLQGRYVSIQRTGGIDVSELILCEVMVMTEYSEFHSHTPHNGLH